MNCTILSGISIFCRHLLAVGVFFAGLTLEIQASDAAPILLANNPPPPPPDITNINSDIPSTANPNAYVPPNTNVVVVVIEDPKVTIQKYRDKLAVAKHLVMTRQFAGAEPKLVELLAEKVPNDIRKEALFQLSAAVTGEEDLPRAQSILTQYIEKWPGDARTPEVLLRQGELFRQMGLNGLALGKFYSVMTAALALKSDQLEYYEKLVLQAQIEIAESHYLMGHYDEAADFYSRLLKAPDSGLNRPLTEFRLVRSLAATTNKTDTVGQAQDFLAHYPNDPEAPEVRYYLAQSLQSLGQTSEALRQVIIFLQQEKTVTKDHPDIWAYWQLRIGNEIGNELFKEGDYVKALDIYNCLLNLDDAPAWRIPVEYQIGITYERLMQPQKAMKTYDQIFDLETAVGTNSTPTLQTVFDMSRWRTNFLSWQSRVEILNQSMAMPGDAASLPAVTNPPPAEITSK
jgi:tetratricopeptide (TPR) repeat protein